MSTSRRHGDSSDWDIIGSNEENNKQTVPADTKMKASTSGGSRYNILPTFPLFSTEIDITLAITLKTIRVDREYHYMVASLSNFPSLSTAVLKELASSLNVVSVTINPSFSSHLLISKL